MFQDCKGERGPIFIQEGNALLQQEDRLRKRGLESDLYQVSFFLRQTVAVSPRSTQKRVLSYATTGAIASHTPSQYSSCTDQRFSGLHRLFFYSTTAAESSELFTCF